jgi:citrate/tricarballylate utilization protein
MTVLSAIGVLLGTYLFKGPSVLLGIHTGENAFYGIVPYAVMVLPFSAIALFILAILLNGVRRLWLEMGAKPIEMFNIRPHIRTIGDVLRLRYLAGGGYGCNYPDDRFSMLRRWFHQLVLFGFLLCLASTIIAAVYEHFVHWHAPYPFMSWPVLAGTLGGLALLIGAAGLLILKWRMDKTPAPCLLGMDIAFILLLLLTSLTGLLLLTLRDTQAMGILLSLHIGFVLALFMTLPYGKFLHAFYRYAALLLKNVEQSRCDSESEVGEKRERTGEC